MTPCDYIGSMTGLPCANPDADHTGHYTASTSVPQLNDTEASDE